MCGRTCLTLEPQQLMKACKYKPNNINKCNDGDRNSKVHKSNHNNVDEYADSEYSYITPEWRAEFNGGRKYFPSHNIAPTDITPVLVSRYHFNDENVINDKGVNRLLVPMMWGMIPFWHKGDYRKHGLSTNNCRMENILQSKLYADPFKRGQRCVILCEGFYEWQTTKTDKSSERMPYFLYMPQNKGVKIYDRSTWQPENVRLLKLAGLFNLWDNQDGDKIFSYSIITLKSSKVMSWLHNRMPAILKSDQQINDWLDYKRISDRVALNILRPSIELEWYKITNFVNWSRNKGEQCNQPLELISKQKPVANKIMSNWLNSGKRKESDLEEEINIGNNDDSH